MNNLYGIDNNSISNFADDLPFSVNNLVAEALRNIYEKKYNTIIDPNLFEATFNTIHSGISQAYVLDDMNVKDVQFLFKLTNSAKLFAAQKSALQVTQLTALLINDATGKARTWSEFKKLAKNVVGNYNTTWLKTEYTAAIASARSARQYDTLLKDMDIFPNLEYMHTLSPSPRKDHETYVGTIRPVQDEFWETHLPPLDWHCKCWVTNTDKKARELRDDLIEPVNLAFQNNPSLTGEIFNISATTYAQQTKHIPITTLQQELKTRILPELKSYVKAYSNSKGGSLTINAGIAQEKFNRNVSIGLRLAKINETVQLEATTYIEGTTSIDATIDKKKVDFRIIKDAKSILKAITYRAERAEVVLLTLKQKISKKELIKQLRAAFIHDTLPVLESRKEVWILYTQNQLVKITRKEILKKQFSKLL
jgi:Phage Mu protein F like protein